MRLPTFRNTLKKSPVETQVILPLPSEGDVWAGVPKFVSNGYEILWRTGEGGMGVVYAARALSANCIVALKVLKPEIVESEIGLKRFMQEAKASAELTHTNICQTFGLIFDENNTPCLVMEYIDGETLAQHLRTNGRVSPPRAVDLLLKICDALLYAHQKGVIHRDLKPSNIILLEEADGAEDLKLVDFGIAKLKTPDELTGLTLTGEALGSPQYMSPEQCRGNKIDERSDIYSFGCVLYEMLAGEPLVSGTNYLQILMRQLDASQPANFDRLKKCKVGSALIAVCAKLLEKSPCNRYQTMKEVFDDLSLVKLGKAPSVLRIRRHVFMAKIISSMTLILLMSAVLEKICECKPIDQIKVTMSASARAISLIDRVASESRDFDLYNHRFYPTWADGNLIDREERQQALRGLIDDTKIELVSLGPSTIPTLIQKTRSDPWNVCCMVLQEYGSRAVEPIVEFLSTNEVEPQQRNALLRVLSNAGKASLVAAAPLLESQDESKRQLGADLVDACSRGRANYEWKELNRRLTADSLALLEQPGPVEFRLALLRGLGTRWSRVPLTVQTSATLRHVISVDNDEQIRLTAVYVLSDMMQKSRWNDHLSPELYATCQMNVKTIASLLGDRRSRVRIAAADALAQCHQFASSEIPHLRAAEGDRVQAVRKKAIAALCAIGGLEVIPELKLGLKGADQEAYNFAAASIQAMGTTARPLASDWLTYGCKKGAAPETIDVLLCIEPDKKIILTAVNSALATADGLGKCHLLEIRDKLQGKPHKDYWPQTPEG